MHLGSPRQWNLVWWIDRMLRFYPDTFEPIAVRLNHHSQMHDALWQWWFP